MDKLHFICNKCYMPHLFYFIVPTKDPATLKEGLLQQQKNLLQSGTLQNLDDKILPLVKKSMDKVLNNKWSMIEKESLKKYILQFGYGRWNKIRKYSQRTCKILKDKSD